MVTTASDSRPDLAKLNEILARHLASNDRFYLIVGVWARLFPLLLSSLIAVYSVITASFFYGLSGLIDNTSIAVIQISILITIFSISSIIIINSQILVELRISKRITGYDKLKDQYTVRYEYRPIYEDRLKRAIKKTANDLLSTAFVILFPGGIADILLGIVANDPEIGIDTTGQVITGIVFTAISTVLLAFTIKAEAHSIKRLKEAETNRMKSIIEKVQEELLKSESIRVIFDKSSQDFTSD